MTEPLAIYTGGAIAVGFTHTALGIDHYLPFVLLGRVQGWSLRKMLGIAFLCGAGHILSSVLLGLAGVWFGLTLEKMEIIHQVQGNTASWLLIVFGMTYAGWSFAKARRAHRHMHAHGSDHVHAHDPEDRAAHDPAAKARIVTTWSLFLIFVLGPCEPLIPLMILPALQHQWAAATHVAAVFSATTILSMLALVAAGHFGLNLVSLQRLDRYAHTFAGLAIAVSGLAIKLLGI